MTNTDTIAEIARAFSKTEYPGDWCLKGSTEGTEPLLLEKEFAGKTDWTTLTAEFLDQAPDGCASALSLFSDEAFRFFLPAYMIADLKGELERSTPSFHLTHGLDNETQNTLINPRRYGRRTWRDAAFFKFSMFSSDEVKAIKRYIEDILAKSKTSEHDRKILTEALDNYWNKRAGLT